MALEDTKQKYIDALGPDFGGMLHKVEDEWLCVLRRYQEIMDLFGKGEKRVALLYALSPAFALDLQVELSNALILGLCRLTDNDRRSVSVCQLPKFIRDKTDLKAEVSCHVAKAQTYAEAARVRRNKWIAHTDRKRPDTPPPVLYKEIKAGLDAVHAALDAVAMDYMNHSIPNKDTSLQMRKARFAECLESLVEGVMYIESRIDPTGESEPFDDEVSRAFLRRIGGDPSADLGKLQRLRSAAKTIKEGLG